MKLKKIMAGILTVAVMASVITVTSRANPENINAEPVAVYTFEDSLQNDAGAQGDTASALVTGLGNYTGMVTYGGGRKGSRAVRLGDYGLRLNKAGIGTEYTVSAWVKADGAFLENQSIIFLGYHSPEKWVALSGNTTGGAKFWCNDGSAYRWAPIGSGDSTIPAGEWHNLVIKAKGETTSFYMDGKLLRTGSAPEALNGGNQDIYIGVNYWDNEFAGYVDDVAVYNTALSDEDIVSLADIRTPDKILSEDGFSVTEKLKMIKGQTKKINVTVDSAVTDAGARVSYASGDASVADVSNDGVVEALKAGNTVITTTISIGGVSVSRTTAVLVEAEIDPAMKDYAVYYDMSDHTQSTITDMTGRGNDAEINGSVSFGKDGSDDVLHITNSGSYVSFPLTIMDSLTDREKFSVEIEYLRSSSCPPITWLWCFGSNPKSTGTNYLFFCPSFDNGAIRAGIKNNSTEILFNTTTNLENDRFYKSTLVFNEGMIDLYVDGVKVKEGINSGYNIYNDVVAGGCKNGILGYIGKSCWTGDKGFVGDIKSFKIYDKALSEEDIQNADKEYYQKQLEAKLNTITAKSVLGRNSDPSSIMTSLSLPQTIDEYNVEWSSSDESVITSNGKVTRPEGADKDVTLTIRLSSGTLSAEKQLKFTVIKKEETYSDKYMNPWDEIEKTAPETRKTVKVGDEAQLFSIPASVTDAVTVEYYSSDNNKVTYKDGKIKALAKGKATVTAIVTAKYNNYVMEYSTALDITDDNKPEVPTPTPDVPGDATPTPDVQGDATPTPDVPADITPIPSAPAASAQPTVNPTPVPGAPVTLAAPKGVKIKRMTKGKTNVKASLVFISASNAKEYIIYHKSKTVKKFTPAYKVKGKKLYIYNAKTKKYKKAGKVKVKKNVITVTLKKLNLKKEKKISYKIYAVNKDIKSKASKTVTIK